MARPCKKPLKSNPFTARRNPKTGRWEIIKPNSGQKTTFLRAIQPSLSVVHQKALSMDNALLLHAPG
jgi:hypothetical protein